MKAATEGIRRKIVSIVVKTKEHVKMTRRDQPNIGSWVAANGVQYSGVKYMMITDAAESGIPIQ